MNVLILSVGTRNKIVQYFKASLAGMGNIVAADMDRLAPALYDADKYYIVPPMEDDGYLDAVCSICQSEEIKGVLSLIDPELSLLAKNRDRFNSLDVTVIGSPFELCELSLDKFKMYQWLKRYGYKCAESYVALDGFYKAVRAGQLNYPVFVKPVRGSASADVCRAYDSETVELLFRHSDKLMIQEYLKGQEIGADVYIDMISREVVSIFTKKKIKMRSGETDKAVSYKDEKLFRFIEKFVKQAGFTGQIDVDLFQTEDDYYISEVNPRFGGGYPHAYECGADHMRLILNNLSGVKNEVQIGRYREGVYMMKYSDLYIKDMRET